MHLKSTILRQLDLEISTWPIFLTKAFNTAKIKTLHLSKLLKGANYDNNYRTGGTLPKTSNL